MDAGGGFSIIMPVYNGEKTIRKTINSVLAQTYSNWELIIVDDGSKDNSVSEINQLEDSRITLIQQRNQGVSTARNTGISHASKTYITFLDCDDEVTIHWLRDFHNLIGFANTPQTGFASCGISMPEKNLLPREGFNINDVKFQNLAGSFIIHREVLFNIGLYDINLKHSENWEMVGRALDYCVRNELLILYTNSLNLIYNFVIDPTKQHKIDTNRAHAALYMYKKYYNTGVLHYNLKAFLPQAAVINIKLGKIKRGRRLFLISFKKYFSFINFVKYLLTFNPFVSKKK